MARKNRLDPVKSTANAMIGIVTSHRDYMLAHFINKDLGINLVNQEDLPVYLSKTNSLSNFPFFSYYHPDLRTDFCLIGNYNGTHYVFPALKQLNYILLFQGAAYQQHINDYIALIRKIQGIQAAIHVNQPGIRDLNGFLEDLELHKIEIQKKQEEKAGLKPGINEK